MRQGDVTDPPAAEIFVSYCRQHPDRLMNAPLILIVRTTADPMGQMSALRQAVHAQDPSVAIDSEMTMEDRGLRPVSPGRGFTPSCSGALRSQP